MYNLKEMLLTPNKYSRPQKPMGRIKGIAIHWVANPKSTALGNRNYFESLKVGLRDASGGLLYGSAHEIIDLDGSVLVDVPANEIAYHVGSSTYTQRCLAELGNYPNSCMYGIECTHIDWNGLMTPETYNTLIYRCADLCKQFGLNPLKNLWTHKEVVGWKDCHRWFVYNPQEWELFKQRVFNAMNPPVVYPQWQIDNTNFLNQQGFLTTPHKPDEIITMGIFGYMINNHTDKLQSIDPIVYLMNKGYLKSYHDRGELLKISVFGAMIENVEGQSGIDPMTYLTMRKYITSPHNPNEDLTMWLCGAMIRNIMAIRPF